MNLISLFDFPNSNMNIHFDKSFHSVVNENKIGVHLNWFADLVGS